MPTLFSRLLDLVLRRRREDRLSEEVQAHLDLRADDYVAQGMPPADARLAARKAFGGVDQTKMLYREQRGLPVVDVVAMRGLDTQLDRVLRARLQTPGREPKPPTTATR